MTGLNRLIISLVHQMIGPNLQDGEVPKESTGWRGLTAFVRHRLEVENSWGEVQMGNS